ncbi:phytoene desaturase family protein [uncultured Amnibacterium sp.]|uniref:phytoene desaturase family protein n=1 Tax=uncultured Amnibacterium sp. TaxID=1631851 RepID=UPI0035C9E068
MSASADPGYDVVVLGGGYTGLVLSALLGAAGRHVAVLEQESELGGRARADHALGADLIHHPHAVLLGFADVMPLRHELRSVGLRWAVPVAQHALAFADGRPAVVLHRRDHLRMTHDSIAAVSRADATLLVEILQRSETLSIAVGRLLVTAPDLDTVVRHLDAVHAVYSGLPLPSSVEATAIELITTAFVSPEVQSLLLALAHEFGGDPFAPGSAIGFLGVVAWQIGRRAVPIGGMGSVVAAIRAVAAHAGADLFTDARVVGLIREEGRVAGAVCADGRIISAPSIVSTLGEVATHELAEIPAEPARTLGTTSVLRQHLVLDAPLRLASERATTDRAVQTFFGWDEPTEMLDRLAMIGRGAFPAPGGALLRPTIADATQRPREGDLLLVDSTFPGVQTLSGEEIEGIGRYLSAATWSRLRDYAGGSEPRLLAGHVAPPGRGDRQIRLRPGVEHYRTSVPGLWRAGAGVHPGGGVHGGSAAIVAGLLSER